MNSTSDLVNIGANAILEDVINGERLGRFNPVDYALFGIMMLVYMGIGVYFGYMDDATKTVDGYLYGNGKIKVLPIAVSLISSQLSAYSIVSIPSEIYAFGSQYMNIILTFGFVVITVNYMVLPMFFKNNFSNCYTYLDLRFNKNVRHICISCLWIFGIPAVPIVSFIPSMALAHVSGLNVHLINTVVMLICIFYTMMGGIKAIVWTDVVQAVIMMGGVLIISIITIVKIGSFTTIWNTIVDGNRLQPPDMTFDLTTRSTFWNIFIGQYIQWTAYLAFNQVSCQRILSLPSLAHARKALIIYTIGVAAIMFLNCSMGLLMYVIYADCDPVKAGVVQKNDQMIPYFVQDMVGYIPGMPGVFISCVFSASLSTISPLFNSIAGIVYNDYIRPKKNYKHTERKGSFIMKSITLALGLFCIVMGFAIDNIKSILQIFTSIVGLTHGSLFAVFLLGMFYPRANAKGAIAGMVCSMVLVAWLIVGSLLHMSQGKLVYDPLPSSLDGCDAMNITIIAKNASMALSLQAPTDDGFSIYHIAFPWYCVIGFLLLFIIAIPISHITGNIEEVRKINPSLIHPVAHFLLPKEVIVHSELIMKNGFGKYEPTKS